MLSLSETYILNFAKGFVKRKSIIYKKCTNYGWSDTMTEVILLKAITDERKILWASVRTYYKNLLYFYN